MTFMALLDELRRAVAADGRSHAAIAREAEIHVKTFSAFMNGRRGLSIETIEALAGALRKTVLLADEKKRPAPRTK